MASGDPWFGLAAEGEESEEAPDLAIFGIPYDGAVFFRRGAAEAPDRIRALSSRLPPASEDGTALTGVRVLDLGDVVLNPLSRRRQPESEDSILRYYTRIRESFLGAREQGLPLALGGDHSVSIPLISAAGEWAWRDVGVVWIDAHPDLCDSFNGSKLSHACVLRRALETPFIKPDNVVMLGLRSYEVEELAYMAEQPLTALTAQELSRRDAPDVGAEIVSRFADMPVYLSLDIDAFDPAYAPGTGIPDAGGLTARWVLDLLHSLAPLQLAGVDIVEVAPPLDVPSDATSLLALKVILGLLRNLAG